VNTDRLTCAANLLAGHGKHAHESGRRLERPVAARTSLLSGWREGFGADLEA